jgi:uncharacterized integral membrane protein
MTDEPAMTDEPQEQRAPEPVEETRFRRGLRYTHRTWQYASLLALIAAGVYLILLISRNTRHVKVDYVFGSSNARVVWLIVVSAITGWVLGLATSFLMRRRTRAPRPR